MKRAVFPGSFDPVTAGHMDLIARGAALFDELILAVLVNVGKFPLFSVEERAEMLGDLTKNLANVSVKAFDGLLADFVEQEQVDVIVRGLRTPEDFAYELPIAQTNKRLNRRAETIFLATAPEYSYISSSGIKEIHRFGGDIKGMVPDLIWERMANTTAKP